VKDLQVDEFQRAEYIIANAIRRKEVDVDLSSVLTASLPASLIDVPNLRSVSVNTLRMTSLPSWLGKIKTLTDLRIQPVIPDLPAGADSLDNIETLSLTNTGWMPQPIPAWIGGLPNLRRLFLETPGVRTLPEDLHDLKSLQQLWLNMPQLIALPTGLAELTDLRDVTIHRSSLESLPDWLAGVESLKIADSPTFISPPRAIVAQGGEAIKSYLLARRTDPPVRQWTSKIMVVGEATVGKTSLAKRLAGKPYDPNEGQTHGVHIDEIGITHPEQSDVVMRLTVWDFGGQLEYRATQRFYLTDRSLFILAWNARARWRDGRVISWLDVIASRAPYSPVLIVATHIDEATAASLPASLNHRFPQIAGIYAVDSATGRGIADLQEAIQREAAQLPLMGAEWPGSWAAAAEALRGERGYACTDEDAWTIMETAGVPNRLDQQTIARTMHDLGEIVYFADDYELAKRIILHPDWLDRCITAVLDSDSVMRNKGILTRAERDSIWHNLNDPDLCLRLVQMMERFDLAYRIGNLDDSEDVALIVERLEDSRPHEVDALWLRAGGLGKREIGIAYKLKSRQAGIPTWFIAREHRYTLNMHWSHGVLLYDRDPDMPAYALLTDDESDQPTIELRVRGRYPVRFLSVLAEAFEGIVEQRYPGLIDKRLVPCICSKSTSSPCIHLFPLEEVILEATDDAPGADQKVRCPRSQTKFSAKSMLDGLRGSVLESQLEELKVQLQRSTETLTRVESNDLAMLNGIRDLLRDRAMSGAYCPSLFSIERGKISLRGRNRVLRLWCEWPYGPDGPHALGPEGGYSIPHRIPDWLREYLPYLVGLAKTLGIAAQLIAPGLAFAGTAASARIEASLEAASRISEDLEIPKMRVKDTPQTGSAVPRSSNPVKLSTVSADFRALRAALRALDPAELWGGLRATIRPEDRRILYLCQEHAQKLEYPFEGTVGSHGEPI
jgi:internalin A